MSEIKISNIGKNWGAVEAVKNVTFTVPEQTFTVLLGPSGCGKSTLLRMICGLEEVSSGNVSIGGRDVTQVEASKRGVSMVFQSYALFPHLSVKENIQFGLKVRRVPAAEREERMNNAASIVGLTELLERKPANLSGGQRQRVALARTIVSEQTVCLMDEPLSNLDSKLRAEMRDEIRSLQQRLGLTVVYVTHDQVEAMSMADQIVLLRHGEVVQIGTPVELYTQPSNVFGARFIGVPPMNVLGVEKLNKSNLPKALFSKIEKNKNISSIGIRPEHIDFSEQGLPVEVLGIDYFGGETVIRVKYFDNKFFVRCREQPVVRLGDSLNLSWKAKDSHLFDRNGDRITA
jgi:sn-glycerol 3-phosphate transport system ATP-binding protein